MKQVVVFAEELSSWPKTVRMFQERKDIRTPVSARAAGENPQKFYGFEAAS